MINFKLLENYIPQKSGKKIENIEVSVSKKKISAPIPILKLDLGFGHTLSIAFSYIMFNYFSARH